MKEYLEIVGMCLLEVYEKKEGGIITICNCKVTSHVMLVEYGKLKIKLEDLPDEEKNELWKFANDNFQNCTKEQKINICKIVHVVGELM